MLNCSGTGVEGDPRFLWKPFVETTYRIRAATYLPRRFDRRRSRSLRVAAQAFLVGPSRLPLAKRRCQLASVNPALRANGIVPY